MTVLTFTINSGTQSEAPVVASRGVTTAANVSNLFVAMGSGTRLSSSTLEARTAPVRASGTVTLSGSSGIITTTINGVAVATGSLAGTDTQNAAAVAVVINASVNALVAGMVTATSLLGVVTVTAVDYGKSGNGMTLAASGTGATASGARLTGGTNGSAASFVF